MTFHELDSLLAARGFAPKGTGPKRTSRCPGHEDRNASLSFGEASDGKLLLHCHAGCTTDAVCAALGLKTADLFPPKPHRNGASRSIVATYPYKDANGALLFEAVRYSPKGFSQRRPDGAGGWINNLDGIKRTLYRLPEILRDLATRKPIFVVEGERDAHALVKAGFTATTNSGGAGKWRPEYSETLRGADVFILPDKDAPGRKHGQDVARSLNGIAATVRIAELPDLNGKPVKDASDFFAAGGTATQLLEICDGAPIWTPPEAVAQPPIVTTASETPPSFDKITADLRGEIIATLSDKEATASEQRRAIAELVLSAICKVGRLYFHAERRDFETAMFFDGHRRQLQRIRSDAFVAWVSDWLRINRAESLFKNVISEIETAALSSDRTTGILPEGFWASRPGAIYLSNGDGHAAKITAAGVALVDNGSDGVLFAAGRTLQPWKLTAPCDPFESCSLFRDAHCAAGHGPDLLRLWLYSLPSNPRSKPPLCLAGEIGSGKTRLAKGFAEFYGLPFVAHKVEESAESDFWPCCDQGGIFTLDNADTRCRWLADAVANAATDGCSQRRKLYTNGETVILRARAWLVITTANPTFASDSGLADRLLLGRMARRDTETSDGALSDEIAAARDGGLSHLAETLHRALADTDPTPAGLNARHPDFAAFAVRIGRALGREMEAIASLKAAEADKAAFCLENDNVAAALLAFLGEGGSFTGTAAELVPKLVSIDAELEGRLSAKRLAKRLAALWPHLGKALAAARKEPGHGGIVTYTLKAGPNGGFGGFQTVFS